ncbi:MAG: hypothetical protein R3E79_12845 [Caldilineaceae bacterium]
MISVTLGRLLLVKKRLLPTQGQRWDKFLLVREIGQKSYGRQRLLMGLCAVALLAIIYFGSATAWARPDYRPTYQESPFSPIATPVTSTITMTAPLPVTVTSPVSIPVISPVATPVTAPLVVTDTVPVTDAINEPPAAPVVVPTVELVNQGQTSLLLVGAILVGFLLVVGLVIGRQR